MKIHELLEQDQDLIPNPFKQSRIQSVLYHATRHHFTTFLRNSHGIYVARSYDYVASIYSGDIIPLYADVRKVFRPDVRAEELDWVYDMDYQKVSKWLKRLEEQGYDAVEMYGDGDSLILFGNIKIVHARTGKEM